MAWSLRKKESTPGFITRLQDGIVQADDEWLADDNVADILGEQERMAPMTQEGDRVEWPDWEENMF